MSDQRCHLCRIVVDEKTGLLHGGLWWCRDFVECNFRTRGRLGVPLRKRLDMRKQEREQQRREAQEAA